MNLSTGTPNAKVIFEVFDTLQVDGLPGGTQVKLIYPRGEQHPARALAVDLEQPPISLLAAPVCGNGTVHDAGRFLLDSVMAHPGVRDWLTTALRTRDPQRYEIAVQIGGTRLGEALPWETLCADREGFIGLDARWLLSRIVEGIGVVPRHLSELQRPRIAAVLSCLGVSGADEWHALRDALHSSGFEQIQLLVLVCEQSLYEEICAAPIPNATEVEVVKIAGRPQLLRALATFRPDILHLFCHGSDTGTPSVKIATVASWDAHTEEHSFSLDAQAFREEPRIRPAITLLNACGSAAPADLVLPAGAYSSAGASTQSLALELVNQAVTAAAIGMREPVPSTRASTFTQAFYEALGTELEQRSKHRPTGRPLEWPKLVREARLALIPQTGGTPPATAAASNKAWSLPVLYLRPPEDALERPDPDRHLDPELLNVLPALETPRAAGILVDHITHLLNHAPTDLPEAAREALLLLWAAQLDRLERQ